MADRGLPKGKDEFRLNEVCKFANVQPYMLRFWDTEFPQLVAARGSTGQRIYSRDQVLLILEIRRLLFDEGLTIAGAKKRIEQNPKPTAEVAAPAAKAVDGDEASVDSGGREQVENLRSVLLDLRSQLEELRSEING